MAYYLDCQECGFESYVEGTHEALLDEMDAHRENHESYHFIEFELVEDADPM